MKSGSKFHYLGGSLILLAGLTAATPVLAASAEATVSVKVVRNISISNRSGMSFGYISTSALAGSVTLDQDGNRHVSGGVVLETGGAPSPAKFVATGEPNTSFSVSLPPYVTIRDDNGNEMLVSGLSAAPGGSVAIFDTTGSQVLNVGAVLKVNPNQAIGDYVGTLTVLVSYN
jgi:hypothetical protein